MKIIDLIKNQNNVYTQGITDLYKELKITSKINLTDSNTIYFHLKQVGKKDYLFPTFINEPPFVTVCEHDISGNIDNVPLIKVNNSRKALAYACSSESKIDYSKTKIIGITGTNGKSSTSEILCKILREAGYSTGYIGTGKIRINDTLINEPTYSMTTPDPELLYPIISRMINEGCQYIVMEISSHAIALSKIAPIHFECGIFTNLSREHMDFHNEMEGYYKTKLSLFNNCKCGIFNMDDEYSSRAYYEVRIPKFSVGVLNKADAYITDLKYSGIYGSSFFYREKNMIFKMKINLGGYYNIYNSLLAVKCAIALGISPCITKKALLSLDKIPGRLERIEDGITVIIDYAHTPLAFENVLKTINQSKKIGQNTIAVFGCGGERDKTKRKEMGKIAEVLCDWSIVTEDNSRSEPFEMIKSDILSGTQNTDKFTVIKSRSQAIKYAIIHAKKNDIVAIIGKGDEKYLIDENGYQPYSEKNIVIDALKERARIYADQTGI